MRALSFFTVMAMLLPCAINGSITLAATPPMSNNVSGSTLVAIKGSLDSLSVNPGAFDDSKALKIAIAPLHIEYPKQRRNSQPYYRDSDFQLTPRDIDLLQKTIVETFTASWFEKRHWQLVNDSAAADAWLIVDIKDFWLAAPLNESIQVHKTFTEESARFTLTGRIERSGDGQHLIEFSDKRKVRPLGTPVGRMERFTAVTFWRDIRLELNTFASQLDRLLPSGKNSHNS